MTSGNEGSAKTDEGYSGGFIRDFIVALFCVFIVWAIISTVMFAGWCLLGMGVCLFDPSAAVCSDTLGEAFHVFYWEMWLKLLNPWTWLGPFYGAMPR